MHIFGKSQTTQCLLIFFIAIPEITEFQTVVDGFLQIANALSTEVEKEKLKVNLFDLNLIRN